MNIESWCRVEAKPEENWLRANRKHFPDAMKSSVFKFTLPDRFEVKGPKVTLDELPKRTHFPQKCKSMAKN